MSSTIIRAHRRRRLTVGLLVAAIPTGVGAASPPGLAAPLAGRAATAPAGLLDPTFGPSGTPPGSVLTAVGSDGGDRIQALVVQPDGKVVGAGIASTDGVAGFALARYNSDGSLDRQFNPHGALPGTLITPIGDGGYATASALVIQPDGKLVAAGYAQDAGLGEFALARYTAAGNLDPSFNPGGRVPGTVLVPIGDGGAAFASGLILQPDGKLVAAGNAIDAGASRFALARWHPDGSLDRSFGAGGIALTTVGASGAEALALVRQADGKLVAAGDASTGTAGAFALARYTTGGTLDRSFDPTGSVPGTALTPIGNSAQATALAAQRDGKLVVAGSSTSEPGMALARYKADGRLDSTFNAAGPEPGTVQTGVAGSGAAQATALVVEADGKPVAAGYGFAGGVGGFALARLNPDGTRDTTFDPRGAEPGTQLTTVGDGGLAQAYALAVQADGKLVAGGFAVNGGPGYRFAIARFGAAGVPDDVTPPTCTVTGVRYPGRSGHAEMDVTVRDTGSGLASISRIQISNGAVHVPAFAPATTRPVVVTAVKARAGEATRWSFDATDEAGNVKHCS